MSNVSVHLTAQMPLAEVFYHHDQIWKKMPLIIQIHTFTVKYLSIATIHQTLCFFPSAYSKINEFLSTQVLQFSRGVRYINQWIKDIHSTTDVYIRKMLKPTRSTPHTLECMEPFPEEATWASKCIIPLSSHFQWKLLSNAVSFFPLELHFFAMFYFWGRALRLFSSRWEEKNSLTQNMCHWSTLSLKEDIPDLFSKMALFKSKLYVGRKRGRFT